MSNRNYDLIIADRGTLDALDALQGSKKYAKGGKTKVYTADLLESLDHPLIKAAIVMKRKKYAKGGKVDYEKLRKAGRFGDTEVAWMDSATADKLDKIVGIPSRNPKTNRREYFLGALLGGLTSLAPSIMSGLSSMAPSLMSGLSRFAPAMMGMASKAMPFLQGAGNLAATGMNIALPAMQMDQMRRNQSRENDMYSQMQNQMNQQQQQPQQWGNQYSQQQQMSPSQFYQQQGGQGQSQWGRQQQWNQPNMYDDDGYDDGGGGYNNYSPYPNPSQMSRQAGRRMPPMRPPMRPQRGPQQPYQAHYTSAYNRRPMMEDDYYG